MGLIFVPLYIRFLGIEAYGLIGVFALLQAWLGLLDMGLTPTMSREMARFTGGSRDDQSIRDLLRSVEWVVFAIAIFIVIGIFLAAQWIANDWLKVEDLPITSVARAIAIMGVVTALRFVENIYRSSIIGLQKQVLLNTITGILATIRGLGAVGILAIISPTINAFFIWQAVVSIITVTALAVATYRSLPSHHQTGQFSIKSLNSISKFAGGMLAITLSSLLLTQADKVILSRMLNLENFGYYTLAATVATMLYVLLNPITQAVSPRFNQLFSQTNDDGFATAYHQAAQLVSVVVGSAAIVLFFFSDVLLELWTQDHIIARRSAALLSLLALGNLLNYVMWIPFLAQVACGWTELAIKINVCAIIFVVPATIWATLNYGAEGAASVWICLNLGYILFGAPLMYRRILKTEAFEWYFRDLACPLISSSVVVGLLRITMPHLDNSVDRFFALAAASVIAMVTAASSASYVRVSTLKFLTTNFCKQKPTASTVPQSYRVDS